MKGPLDRTKVVVRHLPPTISQSNFAEHVDSRFAGRYTWLDFRPGKSSLKHLIHSRAYINFHKPEDVLEFAEFFNGHVFVNEKGVQFKAIVEYAPSQRVPKQWSKKDGREGTILKDPEYLEFLDFLAKPVENLPSAEIQLERKEAAERAGASKDVPIVTPLMDYVRQKRAAKRPMLNGKSTRRVGAISSRSPASGSSRKGSEKKKTSTKYVMRDNSKGGNKDKPNYLLVSKQVDQQLTDKSPNLIVTGVDALEAESGGSGPSGMGKKKILLVKGKEKEISSISDAASLQTNVSSTAKSSHSPAASGQYQQRETGGRIIRSILNRDTSQNQAPPGCQPGMRNQISNQDRDKKLPRPPGIHSSPREKPGIPEEKMGNEDSKAVHSEKPERRMRNKDRPDCGVWTPLRRSDGSHSSNDSLPSTFPTSLVIDQSEDVKTEIPVGRGGDYRHMRGRGGRYSADNGSYRHGGRRSSSYNIKDTDGSSVGEGGKPSKRGAPSGYGSHEKQVWVQKSTSGS
ncbi:regulator of nonsense transcripts UPF3-like isoform X2 [Andrographis paniculata]|uniref:regulator of nonsense transcripts UPF3-like isoform X2 n=1 Tax=Andrographis paniculata TaxID=175694 RepID=UPI0021E8528E|nr:regulator of nonsense transcripts UPF3-like isoform X2 [Andrographis paniculata]